MAEFLTTHGIASKLEQIIIEARTNLFLISPYLQISNPLHERLIDASNRKVNIKIIYKENKLKPNEQEKLNLLKNIRIHFSHNLHAKCYFNERLMIICSLNLYEYSEKNNREMGVLIYRETDNTLYTHAAAEALSILNSSSCQHSQITNRRQFDNKAPNLKVFKEEAPGFCIRCTKRINYNPMKPLCNECYEIWSQFSNFNFIENACHSCGDKDFVTYRLPQCPSCYDEYKHRVIK